MQFKSVLYKDGDSVIKKYQENKRVSCKHIVDWFIRVQRRVKLACALEIPVGGCRISIVKSHTKYSLPRYIIINVHQCVRL